MAEGFRWKIVGTEEPQGALFEQPVFEREVGIGEYRGLEFLHVQAKRIINTLRDDHPLPFRHTINVFRGCSHACNYCMSGDTRVLLADGTSRPIAELCVGDLVIGTERRGTYRRLVATPVLDHWSTVRHAHRVVLDDGTSIVASGDHRFLSNRGWKHVIGDERGPGCRPHLTLNNSLPGLGRFVDGPKLDDDYRLGYLCGMVRGDGHLGHHVLRRRGVVRGTIHQFRLALVDRELLDRSAGYLEHFGVGTDRFSFARATETHRALEGIRTQKRASVEAIERLVEWPSEPSDSWRRGFLAGIYDAEGHLGQVVRITNADRLILAVTEDCLRHLGFEFVREPERENGVTDVRLRGGMGEIMRFVMAVGPATPRKVTLAGRALKTTEGRRVVAVEDLGFEMPMYDITTGTGDFIAEGVVSHNCFARPTHEYLGMDMGDDFDSKIVVKVNAVSQLARELDPRRWKGEPIAMGTNTDPYQRAEGKYRLTRGVIELLSARRNPFSILTKSTLVLRDLDLLAEAARRTDVRVNLSIGTLDEVVWKATEPGTPHPAQRIKAVAALHEAGIPCGVLVAPVIPGLSDGEAQLRAVATAAAEAGARSVSTVGLHLRNGVGAVFLERLAATHPQVAADLAARYERRVNIAGADQARISEVVGLAVRSAGRRLADRYDHRHLAAGPPAPAPVAPPQPGEQLQLL